MDAVTHPDPRVRRALESWIERRVDVGLSAEVARAFAVSAVPTALVVDGHGRLLGRQTGFVEAQVFADWLTSLSPRRAVARER